MWNVDNWFAHPDRAAVFVPASRQGWWAPGALAERGVADWRQTPGQPPSPDPLPRRCRSAAWAIPRVLRSHSLETDLPSAGLLENTKILMTYKHCCNDVWSFCIGQSQNSWHSELIKSFKNIYVEWNNKYKSLGMFWLKQIIYIFCLASWLLF